MRSVDLLFCGYDEILLEKDLSFIEVKVFLTKSVDGVTNLLF